MSIRSLLAGLVGCTLLTGAAVVRGEAVTYTIDPSKSSLTVTGSLTGNVATQQTSGSLTTSYSGTIAADRTPGKILFPGGSVLDASLQSSNQQPRNDGTPGSQPADYGRTAPGPFGTTTFEALRGFQLDLFDQTSGAGINIVGNNFDSSLFGVDIANGESDTIFGTGGNPDNSLAGKGTANSNGNGQSSVVLNGSIETLTLKFSTGPVGYSVSQTADSSLIFSGTIVATREVIPEPASAAMLAAAGCTTLMARRRRRPIRD